MIRISKEIFTKIINKEDVIVTRRVVGDNQSNRDEDQDNFIETRRIKVYYQRKLNLGVGKP